MTYDSRPETYAHSQRVGELIIELVKELLARSTCHDRSKTEEPELSVFNEYTPKLKDTTYGSEQYKSYLAAMGKGLAHHYKVNRHHPEFHPDGIDSMTLVDLIEMLADWKAATERHADGSLEASLQVQAGRFGIERQLLRILYNTAIEYKWLDSGV